ncbi:MAG: ferrous iron transport protein A [Candidatus Cloacimonetes bacterium]|nr:ferrous iron transport protein A [Candidatus Cloacimonadota bacterium]
MENLNLTQLKSNEKATVVAIKGGFGFARRLESLGIREGVEIKKISSQLMRGPITIQIGNSQVALGFGMAQKIIVRKN